MGRSEGLRLLTVPAASTTATTTASAAAIAAASGIAATTLAATATGATAKTAGKGHATAAGGSNPAARTTRRTIGAGEQTDAGNRREQRGVDLGGQGRVGLFGRIADALGQFLNGTLRIGPLVGRLLAVVGGQGRKALGGLGGVQRVHRNLQRLVRVLLG